MIVLIDYDDDDDDDCFSSDSMVDHFDENKCTPTGNACISLLEEMMNE